MSSRTMRPETTVAWLVSDGLPVPTFTTHVWIATRPVTLPGPGGEAYEHIFRCSRTGAERRWGTLDRDEPEAN